MAPSGLYTGLCRTFLVVCCFYCLDAVNFIFCWQFVKCICNFITMRCYAKDSICRRRVSVCLSVCVCVCLSHSGIVSKRLT